MKNHQSSAQPFNINHDHLFFLPPGPILAVQLEFGMQKPSVEATTDGRFYKLKIGGFKSSTYKFLAQMDGLEDAMSNMFKDKLETQPLKLQNDIVSKYSRLTDQISFGRELFPPGEEPQASSSHASTARGVKRDYSSV